MDAARVAFRDTLGSDLNAGIERVVDFDLELQLEIIVLFGSAKERVWAVLRRGTDNGTVHHSVNGPSVLLLPSGKIGAVEQGLPPFAGWDGQAVWILIADDILRLRYERSDRQFDYGSNCHDRGKTEKGTHEDLMKDGIALK
jgi:hypothetical protein